MSRYIEKGAGVGGGETRNLDAKDYAWKHLVEQTEGGRPSDQSDPDRSMNRSHEFNSRFLHTPFFAILPLVPFVANNQKVLPYLPNRY
jgi:hypothetical protein